MNHLSSSLISSPHELSRSCLHNLILSSKRIMDERRGVVYLLLSSFTFSCQIMSAKFVASTFSPFQVLYCRMVLQFLCSSAVLGAQKSLPIRNGLSKAAFLALVVRGMLSAICLGTLYFSLQTLTVGEATVLYNSSPVFASMIGAAVFHEKIVWQKAVALLLLVGSMILVATNADISKLPFVGSTSWLYLVVLFGAFVSSISILAGRYTSTEVSAMGNVWWQSLCAMSVLVLPSFVTPYQDIHNVTLTYQSLLALLGVGICSFVAQALMSIGMRTESSQVTAVLSNFDCVFALLWQGTVFGQTVGIWSLLGAGLYIVSMYVNVVYSGVHVGTVANQETANVEMEDPQASDSAESSSLGTTSSKDDEDHEESKHHGIEIPIREMEIILSPTASAGVDQTNLL
eukprot:PhF_6_TR35130/c0_g1_i1/m.51212